jgi:hypothetical protein
MDKLKFQQRSRTARNKLAEAVSRGNGTGSLAVPPSTLAINDNASTTGVNEGFPGQSAARDFAVPERVPVPQPKLEPPTSLQSSVDAGKRVPVPPPKDAVRTPKKRGSVLPHYAREGVVTDFDKERHLLSHHNEQEVTQHHIDPLTNNNVDRLNSNTVLTVALHQVFVKQVLVFDECLPQSL